MYSPISQLPDAGADGERQGSKLRNCGAAIGRPYGHGARAVNMRAAPLARIARMIGSPPGRYSQGSLFLIATVGRPSPGRPARRIRY